MYKVERIFLYFFIILLAIGWVTNPLIEKIINLKIGIFGFMGIGTYSIFNYIYRHSEPKTYLNFTIEFFISCLLIIVIIIGFIKFL